MVRLPVGREKYCFRTAFYRLRGKQVRPGVLRIDPSTNLPMTVARAVNHLEGFPRQTDEQKVDIPQLKYVLSSSAESRAMALRKENDVVYDGPGGAAFFLMHFASHYFREDESLASLLPKLPEIDPISLPKRRAVRGLPRTGTASGAALAASTASHRLGRDRGPDGRSLDSCPDRKH